MESITASRAKAIFTAKKKPFYHLPPTAVPVKASDLKYAFRALSDPGAGIGKFVSTIINRTGNPNCFLTSSGRWALKLIFLSLQQRYPQTKVIIPAYTCPTVAQAVLEAGLKPVFCDVSTETLDLDRSFLERLVDGETLAIMPTHLYGLAHDISDLVDLGQDSNICIIEDAAQAFGAKIRGTLVGNQGDFGIFSMGRGKCIPTGSGGIILAKDRFVDELEKLIPRTIPVRPLREIASITQFLAYALATNPIFWWFIVRSPLNPAGTGMDQNSLPPIQPYHPSPVQAGIGTSILSRIDKIHAERQGNAQILTDLVSNYPSITIPKIPKGSQPVFLRFPILVEDQARSDRLYELLSKGGIGVSRSYTRTLPDIFSRQTTAVPKSFPGAERLADCLLTLPTHRLTAADIAWIEAAFSSLNSK
jgi:perosamine synthetase